jgi:chemotaxis protein methyltransferase CheR
MTYESDALGLSGAPARLLRDLVHETLGLHYEDSRLAQLVDRVSPLVIRRGLTSLLDYYYLLKYESGREEEWARVTEALVVNETYFWREIDQLQALVGEVVPELVRRLHGRTLQIWTIPCATGEEPLTLAMLLDVAGWFSRASIRIVASDASRAAIDRARAGTYRERALRHVPPAFRERYFTREDGAWRVSDDLSRKVTWQVENLVSPQTIAAHAGASIVLCRNLFIYFSAEAMRKVVVQLAEYMASPAFLCLGAAESLLRLDTPFELRDIGGSFFYVCDGTPNRAAEPYSQAAERL